MTHTKERSGWAISFSFAQRWKADSFIQVLHSFRSRVSFWVPKGRVASASSRGWDSRGAVYGEFSSGIQVEKKNKWQSAKEMQ